MAGGIDAVVLDVVLDGEKACPFADELLRRNITYLLVTGWDIDSLPRRFDGVAKLQKPLDRSDPISALQALQP